LGRSRDQHRSGYQRRADRHVVIFILPNPGRRGTSRSTGQGWSAYGGPDQAKLIVPRGLWGRVPGPGSRSSRRSKRLTTLFSQGGRRLVHRANVSTFLVEAAAVV